MITLNESWMLLSTERTSLLLYHGFEGILTCEHYGARLASLEDAPALTRVYKCPEGTQVSLGETPETVCLSPDVMHVELSTVGRGDFHSPSLSLARDNLLNFDFRFKEAKVIDPSEIPGLPTPRGAKEELVVTLEDQEGKVKVDLHYVLYPEVDVIGRYLVVRNLDESPLTIRKALSMNLGLMDRQFELLSYHGSWANELHLTSMPLHFGRIVNGSLTGSSSARQNPFFALKEKAANQNNGVVYAFNLVYSGSHEESIEMDSFKKVRVQMGIASERFSKTLSQGEEFATPMAIMTFTKDGLNGIRGNMHPFVNEHIIPKEWKDRERPIIYNNWEATTFKFDKHKLQSLMKVAKSYGIETFVLDDGWFGNRDDDSHGLGDWTENLKKIPGGLKGLADHAKKLGMGFGIWMEPEMVNEDSNLYRAHPDWIIKDGFHQPLKSRHQWTLDLSKPEVQRYVVDSVCRVLGSADISFLKWDYNRNMCDLPADGAFQHEYILGLYAALKEIKERYPNVLFENCASGGNRFDLGILSFFPQSWMSDDSDSFERMRIQSDASLGYPLSVMSNHVSAKTSNQLLRNTPLDIKFDVACFGVLGYELDINDLYPIDSEIIEKQVAYYKENRKVFQFGEYRVLRDFSEGELMMIQVTDGETTFVGQYNQIAQINAEEGFLLAHGLEPEAKYSYEVRPVKISLKKFGALANQIAPIHLREEGNIIGIISRHKAMDGEKDEGFVSGSALNAGAVKLARQWSATGYNDKVRLLGDFGGRLYKIKKQ